MGNCDKPGADEGGGESGGMTRVMVGECHLCGRMLSYTNMTKHQRTCRMWDTGGGLIP